MSRFSLKYQVGLTGALSLVGLLSLGSFVLVSSHAENRISDQAASATAAKDSLDSLQIDLLNARRSEKDFLARHDLTYVDKNSAAVEAADADLSRLATQVDDAQSADQVALITTGLQAYQDQFATVRDVAVTVGLDPDSGLQGEMRTAVHAVEDTVTAANSTDLTILMLMMRRHEKDFLARLDPKYTQDMADRATEFTAALATSGLPAATRTDIETNMATYQTAFAAVVEASLRQVDEVAKLSADYKVIEPILASMGDSITTQYTAETARFRADRAHNTSVLTWAVLLLGLLVGVLTVVVARGIYRPLRAITATMNQLAGGDRSVEVSGRERRDEIGHMAAAVQVFKDNAIEIERVRLETIARDERDRADGQRQQQEAERARTEQLARIERERLDAERKQQAMSELTSGFESSVASILEFLAAASTEMQATASSMAGTAADTSVQSEEVSAASAQASSNVQAVAAAAEQLSASVREISRQVTQSAQIAGQAVLEIQRTNDTVRGLADAAEKIGAVVSLVNEIAGQTNLLALNATIEAARAGEAGKGFAVVASEVKDLAKQTAQATEEIAAQVTAIQLTTADAVAVIESIGGTINGVNEIATVIASAVEEQGVAVQEIARNVEQASNGTRRVSDNIASVSSAAGATRTAAQDVLSASGELSEQSEHLRNQVHGFLSRVGAIV